MTHHPKLDENGKQVLIKNPNTATPIEAWSSSTEVATVVPNSTLPDEINGIPFSAWSDAPSSNEGWEQLVTNTAFYEAPFKVAAGMKPASGAVVIEPDGRIWIVSPTNQFGGYKNTFPKGKVDSKMPLSLRANALKEVYEESGLKVALTGFLVDSNRTTTTTRYYLAQRISGSPSDVGWESQAVHLVPRVQLKKLVSHEKDEAVLQALDEKSRVN